MTNFRKLHKELKKSGINVNRIIDKKGRPVDRKIKPLVIALNYKNYKTVSSCEGHPLSSYERHMKKEVKTGKAKLVFRVERGLTYKLQQENGKTKTRTFHETPWVDVKVNPDQAQSLLEIVQIHNNKTGIYWRMEQIFIDDPERYRIETIPKYSLQEMQADIPILAENILDMIKPAN